MLVLKFGGTSLETPQKMKNVFSIVKQEKDRKKIVVLSAISDTTNKLLVISEAYKVNQNQLADKHLITLHQFYEDFIDRLYSRQVYKKKALLKLDKLGRILASYRNSFIDKQIQNKILAHGEILSSYLFHLYIEEQGHLSVLLPALDIMRLSKDEYPAYQPHIVCLRKSP